MNYTSSSYLAYMNSSKWKRKKQVYWKKYGRSCKRCGVTKNLHLHHRTYERFTKELMVDLVGLCASCHDLVHSYHRDNDNISLSQCTEIVIGAKEKIVHVRLGKTEFVPKHLRPGHVAGWMRHGDIPVVRSDTKEL